MDFQSHVDILTRLRVLTLLKYKGQIFCPILSLSGDRLIWKASPLVRSEVLGLFVNTLTGTDKYSRHNREKILQPVQIQLSEKLKKKINFLLQFLYSLHVLNNLKKKQASKISDLTNRKKFQVKLHQNTDTIR